MTEGEPWNADPLLRSDDALVDAAADRRRRGAGVTAGFRPEWETQ